MTTTTLRVLGYVRRSTDKQAMSPETQARRLRDAADVFGWDLTIREEDAASAKSLDGRPVLAEAMTDLAHGQADALAVAALDRLSRSVYDFAGLLNRAKAEGWAVVCLDLGIDTSTSNGRFVAHIRAGAAEWERDLISQRTREGMATIKATTGKHMGRPSAIPQAVEDRIHDLARSQGLSASAIAQLMEDEGVVRPTARSKSWHHSHVLAAVRRVEIRRLATA